MQPSSTSPAASKPANGPTRSIVEPTDAIVRVVLACVCGSDLWYYRGDSEFAPGPIGHEFIGVVEDVGADVDGLAAATSSSRRSPSATAPARNCRHGITTACMNGGFFPMNGDGGQGEAVRVPLADGTLVTVPGSGHSDDDAALAADALGRHGHRPPRRRLRAGQGRPDRRRRRRRRRRPLRRARRQAARRRADHRALPPRRPPGARHGVRRHRHRRRARRGGDRGGQGDDRRRRRRRHAGVRRHRPVDGDRDRHRPRRARWSATSASRTASSCRSGRCSSATSASAAAARPRAPTSPSCSTTCSTGRIDPGRVLDYETDLDGIAEAYAAMDERRAIKSLVRVGTI